MRVSPFIASGVSHPTIAGADRGLMFMLATLCFLVGYAWFPNPIPIAFAIGVFTFGHYWLRRMTKGDPLIVKVKLRQYRYQAQYGAASKYSSKIATDTKHWCRS